MPEASLPIHDMAGCYPPAIQKALHRLAESGYGYLGTEDPG